MNTAVEQEASLIVGRLAPSGVVPLVVGLDAPQDADGEVVDSTELCGLGGGIGEAGVKPDVLGDRKGGLGLGADALSVGDEASCCGDVLGDGLLGENVLASRKSRFDEGRLAEDGEGNDDGGDVVSCKEVLVRLAGARVFRVEIRLGDRVGDEAGGFLG